MATSLWTVLLPPLRLPPFQHVGWSLPTTPAPIQPARRAATRPASTLLQGQSRAQVMKCPHALAGSRLTAPHVQPPPRRSASQQKSAEQRPTSLGRQSREA